ncbi:MAG: efflux RND transporter periplasmic adaptor subunit [Deltaproteobacteria bacterium]|nr:MAG: efflux RND transporter periplasmic adaptor subunit [Deltaproteobacteria bacterium]
MVAESAARNKSLEALRITRPKENARRKRRPGALLAMIILAAAVGATTAYEVYLRTLGRPQTVQTIMVLANRGGQPGVILTGSGYVVTRHKYITIGTKILGQIVAEPIEEGQHVRIGDLLAQIDDRDYQAQLRQAAAGRDLSESKLRLDLARAERARRLFGTGTISRDEYDTAISAAEVAEAALKRDTAAVDYARFQVSQCVITSPINGIVLHKYRELGDTINFGGQIQAGGGATDIVQLADTDDMRAEVDINEVDIAKVSLGSQAIVAPDAYADRRFEASLVKLYPKADRQKGTVKVEVQFNKPDLQIIKPEMSVKVSFLESQPPATQRPRITVPKGAVRIEGGETYVWTVREGIVQRVGIVRGQETETGIEVEQGLNDGDVIVVSPQANLANGGRVVVGTESGGRLK